MQEDQMLCVVACKLIQLCCICSGSHSVAVQLIGTDSYILLYAFC